MSDNEHEPQELADELIEGQAPDQQDDGEALSGEQRAGQDGEGSGGEDGDEEEASADSSEASAGMRINSHAGPVVGWEAS